MLDHGDDRQSEPSCLSSVFHGVAGYKRNNIRHEFNEEGGTETV